MHLVRRTPGWVAAGEGRSGASRMWPVGHTSPTPAEPGPWDPVGESSAGPIDSRPTPSLTTIQRLAHTARSFPETPMPTKPSRTLETFAQPQPRRDYVIRPECPRDTAVCPLTRPPRLRTIVVL